MTEIMALSVITGLLCGLWSQVAPTLGLVTWAGFAACTTYFASGKQGVEGFIVTVRQNLFGVLCGVIIIILSTKFPFLFDQFIYSGILTFVMCIAGRYRSLSFIPGTFVGCFSTFAINGEWKVLVPTLVVGALLGVACDLGGRVLYNLVASRNKKVIN